MDHVRAHQALEPFLLLSKSATSPRAAADLITHATSAPNTYVFAELLATPNILALRDHPDYIPHLKLLEIFAWGTFQDYQETPNLPTLSPAQTHKLHLLTLLPLLTGTHASAATQTGPTIPYGTLLSALPHVDTTSELESLLTTAIYASLLTGTLDPFGQTVHVSSVSPLRDPRPGSLRADARALRAWARRCDEAGAALERAVDDVGVGAGERGARGKARVVVGLEDGEVVVPRGLRVGSSREQSALKRGAEGQEGDEAESMDVDGGMAATREEGRSAKRGPGLIGSRKG